MIASIAKHRTNSGRLAFRAGNEGRGRERARRQVRSVAAATLLAASLALAPIPVTAGESDDPAQPVTADESEDPTQEVTANVSRNPAYGDAPGERAGVAADAGPAPAYDQLIGAGIYTVPQPYEGVGTSIVPVPLANVFWKRFYIYGVEGGFRWRERSLLGWRVFVSPRFMGYESGESEALDGMESRDFSGDAGAGITLRPIPFIFDLSLRTDVLGRSDGEEAIFDADVLLPAAGWLFRPSAGLQWQSEEMVDYYYGVSRDESRPGRPAHEGDAAFLWYVEIEASWKIGARWTFVTGVTSDRLGSGITDSPLVDTTHTETGYVGLLYGF